MCDSNKIWTPNRPKILSFFIFSRIEDHVLKIRQQKQEYVRVASVFGCVLVLFIKDKLQIFTTVDQQIFYNKQTTSTSMPPRPIIDSKRVQQDDDHLDATSVSNLEDQTLNSYGSIPNIVVEGKPTRSQVVLINFILNVWEYYKL